MLDLDKQIQKLKELLEKEGIPENFIVIPKNGFLEVVRKNGYSCYYTLDLKHSTLWEKYKSITQENGIAKITYDSGLVIHLTHELEPIKQE